MKKMARSQFHLASVKLNKTGGLLVNFDYEIGNNSEVDSIKVKNYESTVEPHPDLTTKIRALKPMLLEVHYYGVFRKLVTGEKFKATKAQIEFIENAFQQIADLVTPTGIAVSGGLDKKGVIITGKILCEGNLPGALNTPRIRLEQDLYKFETELSELVEGLEEEVYEYLFSNKKSQLSLFDEEHEH